MIENQRQRVLAAFGRAADTYDGSAQLQRRVATKVGRLAHEAVVRATRVLEIGCGTGFLSEIVAHTNPDADFLFTDISPLMVEACRQRLSTQGVQASYLVMDGEFFSQDPLLQEGFDAIVSSMAFQWFEDFPAALSRLVSLLRPGGRLVFSTLGSGSFREWYSVLSSLDLPWKGRHYPDLTVLAEGAAQLVSHAHFFGDSMPVACERGLYFLRELKAIGAHVGLGQQEVLTATQLRRAIREFDTRASGCVTYHILFGDMEK